MLTLGSIRRTAPQEIGVYFIYVKHCDRSLFNVAVLIVFVLFLFNVVSNIVNDTCVYIWIQLNLRHPNKPNEINMNCVVRFQIAVLIWILISA